MKPVTCNYPANNLTNTTPSIFLPSKHQQLFKKILNVISQLHWESFGLQSDGFVLKESSCAIQARNNFLSSDLDSLQQKGAERGKKKKDTEKTPKLQVLLEKGKDWGLILSEGDFWAAPLPVVWKNPGRKKLLGGKRALLTQSRGGDLPGHRGENKLTSKKSLSPPSHFSCSDTRNSCSSTQ